MNIMMHPVFVAPAATAVTVITMTALQIRDVRDRIDAKLGHPFGRNMLIVLAFFTASIASMILNRNGQFALSLTVMAYYFANVKAIDVDLFRKVNAIVFPTLICAALGTVLQVSRRWLLISRSV